uniref:Somatostatin n=1 Tax=Crocodylus porosus TaxID=8502 RepID=A0A7M4F3J9_CROPO
MQAGMISVGLVLLAAGVGLNVTSAAPFSPPLPSPKELAKYFLAELLSEPSQTENEALEPEDLSRGAEQDEVRLELERSANSNPALAPRERKAGCKNFFWKTFTSC